MVAMRPGAITECPNIRGGRLNATASVGLAKINYGAPGIFYSGLLQNINYKIRLMLLFLKEQDPTHAVSYFCHHQSVSFV